MKKTLTVILLFWISLTSVLAQDQIVEKFSNGLDLVTDGTKYGLKKKSKYIVPVFFDSIVEAENTDNYYLVSQNGNQGIFDKKGKMTVPVSFSSIFVYDPYQELFEITAPGIRAFYITQALSRIDSYLKVDHALLANAYETSVIEWLSIMQYCMGNPELEKHVKTLTPQLDKVDPKTKAMIEYFLNQENSETPFIYQNTFFWESQRKTIDLTFDNSNAQFITSNYKVLLNYPITGISYDQVKLYCEIKSKLFNEELNPYYETDKIVIRFRLPKLNEWEDMALNGLDDSMKTRFSLDSVNVKKCPLYHFKYNYSCESIEKLKETRGEGTVCVNDYFPSYTGLYNIFGNVSEMIDEKGYCKGGSYVHAAAEAKANKTNTYSQPEPWLGFRVVAEIVFETKTY